MLCGLVLGAATLVAQPMADAQTPDPATNPTTGGLAGVDSDGDAVQDNVDAEPCDGRVSARVMVPADRTWGMLLFEDMWPEKGDFDFNDLVLAYNQTLDYDSSGQLRGLRADLRVMAVGARLQSGLALRVPGLAKGNVTFTSLTVDGQGVNPAFWTTESEAVITLASDTHALFGVDQTREWVNTDPNLPSHPYVDIVLEMHFDVGHQILTNDAPFDVFIYDAVRGSEVHLPRYRGTSALDQTLINRAGDATNPQRAFVTDGGIPFALDFPETVVYPQEGIAIDQLFPAIVQYGASSGALSADFFRNPTSGIAYGNISPGTLAAASAVDVTCFAPDPGVCGASAGTGQLIAPTSNLCTVGLASVASASGGLYRWTCAGNYSLATSCDAPDWLCQPNVANDCSASISNGSGTQTCNGSGTGYNTCALTACNAGFYSSGNTCVAQTCTPSQVRTCSITGATATETCNNVGSQWHACTVQSCDSGLTQVGNTCVNLSPTGSNVYYQCANVEMTYGLNSGYVVFVQNVENRRTDTPAELLSACLHYGFKGLATSDSRTHQNNGWGINNSSQIHQAVYCHNCYPSSGNEWYFNRSSHNSCTHASGVATGTLNQNMATYVFNSKATTYACMTFDEDLDSSTAFGNGQPGDATHPWYTDSGGQDPCNRTRTSGALGDNYNGTPDYLLCASATIQN